MSAKFLVSSFFLYFLYFLTSSDAAAAYLRNFRAGEDGEKFTVIYRASNENYSEIADMDSHASFIMSADLIENNKIAKSVKNNEKKQAIILELSSVFINQPQSVPFLVREIVVNFRETVNMELKYVLIAGLDRGNQRVQQFINELEGRSIAVICNYAIFNVVDRIIPEVVFRQIILVNFVNFNSSEKSRWSQKWRNRESSGSEGLSMKKYLRQCSEVTITSDTQLQPPLVALPRQSTVRTDSDRKPSGTGVMTGSSGSSGNAALKTVRRTPRFITGGIKSCTKPNGFTFLFKGLANYRALRNGYHPRAAVLITKAEIMDSSFLEILRELDEDMRIMVLLIEDEDVEVLLSARNLVDKVREYLHLIPGHVFGKHFTFADDLLVTDEIRRAFTSQNAIEIYETSIWNPEKNMAPLGFVVVELETKPGKVLRELDSILDEKELTPLTFSNCIDPTAVVPGVAVNMSEIQKQALFRRKLNETSC